MRKRSLKFQALQLVINTGGLWVWFRACYTQNPLWDDSLLKSIYGFNLMLSFLPLHSLSLYLYVFMCIVGLLLCMWHNSYISPQASLEGSNLTAYFDVLLNLSGLLRCSIPAIPIWVTELSYQMNTGILMNISSHVQLEYYDMIYNNHLHLCRLILW